MKNKMIMGLIILGVVTTCVGTVFASSFEKYKFKTQTTFVHDEERDTMINEVRNSFSDYAKLKVDMYDIYFSTTSVNDFAADNLRLPNGAMAFAQDSTRTIVLNNIQGPSEMEHIGNATRATLYHELGHAIDMKQDKIDDTGLVEQRFGPHNKAIRDNFLYSGTQRFNEIYQKETYYMQKVDGNNNSYFYTTITEYFAQSVFYYMMYPEEMRTVAPETYMFIKNVFDQKYVIPDKELSYGNIQFDVEFFAETDNIKYLKDLIKVERTTINNDSNLKEIVVNKLGEDAKEYLESDSDFSYDDFVENKENPTDNGDTKENPTDNGDTKDKESGFVKDPSFTNCYGWIKRDNKWYYFDEKGNKAIGKLEENGKTYYFDENGQMKTGLIDNPDGTGKVYVSDFGTKKKIGWFEEKGKWYYINADETMKTGWIQYSDKWYYLDSDGAMKTGWVQDKDKWYYLDTTGSMKTGWVQDKDKWYYLNSDGSMAVNTTTPDGYAVDADGVYVK